ncbi:MAG: hypothetical protein KGL53_13280, partial [Elusimicrobia bacterium]|nr:hypothetical protein [Elusimicrobiota bacterium]
GAFWHLDLSASDFVKARRGVENVIRSEKGRSLVGPDSQVGSDKVGYMQWSVVFERARAARALAALERLGKTERAVQQEDLEPEVTGEVAVKLARLDEERKDAPELYDRLPAAKAAVDEIRAHLRAVVEAFKASQDEVLLDISLKKAGT